MSSNQQNKSKFNVVKILGMERNPADNSVRVIKLVRMKKPSRISMPEFINLDDVDDEKVIEIGDSDNEDGSGVNENGANIDERGLEGVSSTNILEGSQSQINEEIVPLNFGDLVQNNSSNGSSLMIASVRSARPKNISENSSENTKKSTMKNSLDILQNIQNVPEKTKPAPTIISIITDEVNNTNIHEEIEKVRKSLSEKSANSDCFEISEQESSECSNQSENGDLLIEISSPESSKSSYNQADMNKPSTSKHQSTLKLLQKVRIDPVPQVSEVNMKDTQIKTNRPKRTRKVPQKLLNGENHKPVLQKIKLNEVSDTSASNNISKKTLRKRKSEDEDIATEKPNKSQKISEVSRNASMEVDRAITVDEPKNLNSTDLKTSSEISQSNSKENVENFGILKSLLKKQTDASQNVKIVRKSQIISQNPSNSNEKSVVNQNSSKSDKNSEQSVKNVQIVETVRKSKRISDRGQQSNSSSDAKKATKKFKQTEVSRGSSNQKSLENRNKKTVDLISTTSLTTEKIEISQVEKIYISHFSDPKELQQYVDLSNIAIGRFSINLKRIDYTKYISASEPNSPNLMPDLTHARAKNSSVPNLEKESSVKDVKMQTISSRLRKRNVNQVGTGINEAFSSPVTEKVAKTQEKFSTPAEFLRLSNSKFSTPITEGPSGISDVNFSSPENENIQISGNEIFSPPTNAQNSKHNEETSTPSDDDSEKNLDNLYEKLARQLEEKFANQILSKLGENSKDSPKLEPTYPSEQSTQQDFFGILNIKNPKTAPNDSKIDFAPQTSRTSFNLLQNEQLPLTPPTSAETTIENLKLFKSLSKKQSSPKECYILRLKCHKTCSNSNVHQKKHKVDISSPMGKLLTKRDVVDNDYIQNSLKRIEDLTKTPKFDSETNSFVYPTQKGKDARLSKGRVGRKSGVNEVLKMMKESGIERNFMRRGAKVKVSKPLEVFVKEEIC